MAHFPFITFLSALLLFILLPSFSSGFDTLLPNQSVSADAGQTLISNNRNFEMGFFSPGKSRYIFLGIWYKNMPGVVVWVANRNNPITDSKGVSFCISRNGTFVISRGGRVILWENASGAASNPVLQLRDSGNLVLVNTSTEGNVVWQSFDYPIDTTLPGMNTGEQTCVTSWRSPDDPSPGDFTMRIENKGLPQFVIYSGGRIFFRSGIWNGAYFCGLFLIDSRISKHDFVFDKEKLVSIVHQFNSPVLSRVKLDTSGFSVLYLMNTRKNKWILADKIPRDSCDEYNACGPNGVCKIEKSFKCECLKGFAPKFRKDWDLRDWFGGCIRIAPLNCGNGDGFLEVREAKYPDMLKYWVNVSMSLGECRAECLKNCRCTAYANPYITNGGSGCVLWFGDLMDMRQVPASDSKQNLYVRVPVSEIVDDSSADLEKEKKRPTRLIFISIATGVIVSGFINGSIFMMRRPKKQAIKRSDEDLDLPLLKFATIVAATNNFSKGNMVGEGGFGPVYKGILPSKEEIAIKRLSATSRQGLEEFKTEAMLIAKLQHTNLVRLLGCCIEGEERMLIYEYLQNKSLDYFVFDQNEKKLLTWPLRFDIVMGIARGLLYLHHDSRLKIIHRDLKTSNILLDENLNPKISDFGLARIFGEDHPTPRTKRVVGTYGYMAPEYAIAGNFSVKSDTFSMGVVLLEIVSGKKNRGFESSDGHFHSLLGHAWYLWKSNKTLDLMDDCLKDTFVESEVKRCIHVGLLCVQNFPEDRPVMSSVLFMLGNDEALMPEPKEPGYFVGRDSTPERSVTSPNAMSERNTITITDLEAR